MDGLRQLKALREEAQDLAGRIMRLKRKPRPPREEAKRLEALYEETRAKILLEITEAEREIQAVPDARLRRALRLKYIDGLTWPQVAVRLDGRPDTAESLRQMARRYLRT